MTTPINLINWCNKNTESEELEVMNQLVLILEELKINQQKTVILAGDFNFFTDTKLEPLGGSPPIKKKTKISS